jgi:hypothetical protein
MTPEREPQESVAHATRIRSSSVLAAVFAVGLLLAGCGPSQRAIVERAAPKRWHARSATCVHRSERLYGCVLQGAQIPLRLQFTDDFLSSEQHRCFRAGHSVVGVSTASSSGYACAFGPAG